MVLQELRDKIAIVTGAARGNGRGIARIIARAGATVILTDIADNVYETAKEIQGLGHKVVTFKMDVANFKEVNQTVQEVLKQFNKVDILVNNAGIYPVVSFTDMTENIWDKILDINLKSVFYCTKVVLPSMIKQKNGKIINISSVTGPMVSGSCSAAYSAAKGAVSGFTRALALEVAKYNINVNAICPGSIDTPGVKELELEQAKKSGLSPSEYMERSRRSIPLGRYGTIEEIGELALFLASDKSNYITGTEIVIDGGNIIQEHKMLI